MSLCVTRRWARQDWHVRLVAADSVRSRSSDRTLGEEVTWRTVVVFGQGDIRWRSTRSWSRGDRTQRRVRSLGTERVQSQNRGSGNSLETTRLWGSRVRSWHRGASGHHLTVGARHVAPNFKNKIRYTPYVSLGSQISYIATNKGNINRECSIYNGLSINNITLDSKQRQDNSELRVKTPIPQGQLTGWSQA